MVEGPKAHPIDELRWWRQGDSSPGHAANHSRRHRCADCECGVCACRGEGIRSNSGGGQGHAANRSGWPRCADHKFPRSDLIFIGTLVILHKLISV